MTAVRKKVIILYASYGDGHIQVSRALEERFGAGGEFETVLVDLFAEAYPALNALAKYVYIKSYTLFPKLYGWSYYSTREMGHNTLFSSWFHSWGAGKLKEILAREQPDAVVNTFPMLAMAELRRKTGIAVPIFTVLTDYTLHWRWIHPQIDRFYVATDDLKSAMIAAGVAGERIEVTGIPLKESFRRVERTDDLYESYGLDPRKRTVLLIAGAYGVLQGLREVSGRLASLPATQVLVVCGKNESLYASMSQSAPAGVKVIGFAHRMHELMSLADTMVTKPGGITLTETIQCGLPVVLLRPVPGQERDNAQYLASRGAATIAHNDEEVTEAVTALLSDGQRRGMALQAMDALRQERSAERIVRNIQEALDAIRAETAAERRRIASERIS